MPSAKQPGSDAPVLGWFLVARRDATVAAGFAMSLDGTVGGLARTGSAR